MRCCQWDRRRDVRSRSRVQPGGRRGHRPPDGRRWRAGSGRHDGHGRRERGRDGRRWRGWCRWWSAPRSLRARRRRGRRGCAHRRMVRTLAPPGTVQVLRLFRPRHALTPTSLRVGRGSAPSSCCHREDPCRASVSTSTTPNIGQSATDFAETLSPQFASHYFLLGR